MSMPRTDEDMIEIIDGAFRQIEELKGVQVVGSDSVRTFKNQTSATWDIQQNSHLVGAANNVVFDAFTKVITFTPENVVNDQPAASFKAVIASQIVMTPPSQYDATTVRAEITRLEPTDPRHQRYRLQVGDDYGNQGQTGVRRIKVYVLATAKGTVTITDS